MDRGWSWRSEPEADSQSFVFVPKEYFVVKRRSRARFVDGGPFEARRAAPGAINCPPHTHTHRGSEVSVTAVRVSWGQPSLPEA